MKKLVAMLLAGAIGVSSAALIAGCSNGGGSAIDAKVEEGQKMTTEQLIEKAKTETGDFIAYGNTSRITKAMDGFVAKYGGDLGLTKDHASAAKKTDSEIYTLLMTESTAGNNSKNASMVLIQDSATLAQYRTSTTILTNYVSDEFKSNVDSDNLLPLAHQFINKLFIYNNTGDNVPKFTNVWELTESKYKNQIYFKSPTGEQVNMNFLIMLTGEEWSAKLETAYKSYKGGAAATDVGADKAYKNYGYKWVKEFLENADTSSYTSDTKLAAGLSSSTNAGKMGLFVLSKLRDSSVTSENLSVSAWDKKSDNTYQKIDPFAGFMYSIYAQLATNGPRPYTAMLFINYLMTEEGFAPWCESIGGYSANKTVPTYQGDSALSFWQENLVIEDGEYIKTVKTEVEDWINGLLG